MKTAQAVQRIASFSGVTTFPEAWARRLFFNQVSDIRPLEFGTDADDGDGADGCAPYLYYPARNRPRPGRMLVYPRLPHRALEAVPSPSLRGLSRTSRGSWGACLDVAANRRLRVSRTFCLVPSSI
jgi:hypothetical protein